MIVVFTLLPVSARADTGPKPSVRIAFEGLGGELCYGTLLSEDSSTGPASAWDGNESHIADWPEDFDYEIWKAFVDYEDADGYYFLQEYWQVNETKQLNWIYYPPTPFKILLYFPESGAFLVSGIYERYAFDSYFTVNMDDFDGGTLTAEQSYEYSWEIISLLARIVITIALELAVALLFGYRRKKQIITIAVVNVFTQTILNVLLNIINYKQGPMVFVFYYFVFELFVFVLEGLLYRILLYRFSADRDKKGHPYGYAFVANLFSFAAGFAIAKWIPGIF